MMRALVKKSLVVLLAVAVSVIAFPATSQAAKKPVGKLASNQGLGISGVSPHADILADGSIRLYYSSMEAGGTAVDECTQAGACTRVATMERISDLTDVVLPDGSRRAYFVELDPNTKQKVIYTAPLSADGRTLGERVSLGISDGGAMAWGVPDAVVLPDNRVRLYWVEPSPSGRMADEVVVSATSTDASGTSFVRDGGYRTTGGFVDFEVLQANDGDWLAMMSTSPENPGKAQRLMLAASDDGLTWVIHPKPLTPASMSYLDPTAVKIGPRKFKVYYAKAPNMLGDRPYELEQGILTVKKSKKKPAKKR